MLSAPPIPISPQPERIRNAIHKIATLLKLNPNQELTPATQNTIPEYLFSEPEDAAIKAKAANATLTRHLTPIENLIQRYTNLPPEVISLIFGYLYLSKIIYGKELNIPGKTTFSPGTPGQLQLDLKRGAIEIGGIRITSPTEFKASEQIKKMASDFYSPSVNLTRSPVDLLYAGLDRAHSQDPSYLPTQAISQLNKFLPEQNGCSRQFIDRRWIQDAAFIPETAFFVHNKTWFAQNYFHIYKITYLASESKPNNSISKITLEFSDDCDNKLAEIAAQDGSNIKYQHNIRIACTWALDISTNNPGCHLDSIQIYAEITPGNVDLAIAAATININLFTALFTSSATPNDFLQYSLQGKKSSETKLDNETTSATAQITPIYKNCFHPLCGIFNLYFSIPQLQYFFKNTQKFVISSKILLQTLQKFHHQQETLINNFRETYAKLSETITIKNRKETALIQPSLPTTNHDNIEKQIKRHEALIAKQKAELNKLATQIDLHYLTLSIWIEKFKDSQKAQKHNLTRELQQFQQTIAPLSPSGPSHDSSNTTSASTSSISSGAAASTQTSSPGHRRSSSNAAQNLTPPSTDNNPTNIGASPFFKRRSRGQRAPSASVVSPKPF